MGHPMVLVVPGMAHRSSRCLAAMHAGTTKVQACSGTSRQRARKVVASRLCAFRRVVKAAISIRVLTKLEGRDFAAQSIP
jgi:hypothetical protein